MRIKKNMNILFWITLVSFVGWFVSWGYLSKDLPVELAFYPLEWANWIWMIIPIYTIYYSYKNRKVGKTIRNIIAAIILIFVLIPGLIPDTNKIEYKNIYKYEKMLNINFPKNGILINEIGLDTDDKKEDIKVTLAYYNKNINISNLEKQIKASDKWIKKEKIDKELKKMLPDKVLFYDDLYILIYNNDTKEYNTTVNDEKKYEIYIAIYCKEIRTLYIYNYQYNNGGTNIFDYDSAKKKAYNFLNNSSEELQKLVNELYESKNSKKDPMSMVSYASYEYSEDFDFKNKKEYIKIDLDSQGMLGGQYYGLIYSKESNDDFIVYDEKKETNKGNNIFIRQKIKDNWYFYYEDYDGKVDINKIKR